MARQVTIRQGGLRNTNEFNQWDDTMCLTKAYFILKVTARLWYENNEENLSSGEKFQEHLKIAFGSTKLFIKQAERELKNRAQKTGHINQIKELETLLCVVTKTDFITTQIPTFTAIDTITIELYIDGVELVNPLGSHTGIHKLGFVYFTIKDLPVFLQSSLGSIFLTNVHYSPDVEKYGYKEIFEPLIQDLKQLLEKGIQFQGNTYKIALWQILGDNLRLNKLFGFVECFSANFCCRFCLVHKNELQKMFKEDNSLLRHKAGHNAHVRDVIDENITTAMCGVKSDCPFNELGYWHVTSNLVDVMHDLLEG
ncbi:c2H2-type domain-containing protein [Trichonephila clavata]|uniref:C2H2-type domain-containing protein n=2 Tax=Trichonephila clavata TaxID=2740835 RepID=A0A8X6LN75_TRICU|nr:c2H2-type domain-containing protein [Trichonephila clavata]